MDNNHFDRPNNLNTYLNKYWNPFCTGAIFIFVAMGGNKIPIETTLEKTLTISAGVLLITAPYVVPFLYKKYSHYKKNKKLLSDFVIYKQKILIDMTDEGRTAYHTVQTIFYSTNKKKNYTGTLVMDGPIEVISQMHCSVNVRSIKTASIMYEDPLSSIDQKRFDAKQLKYFVYSTKLTDCFKKDEDYWHVKPKHHVLTYQFQLVFPAELEVENTWLLYKSARGEGYETSNIEPVLTKEHGRDKIILLLEDIAVTDDYKLVWKTKSN